MLSNTIFRVLLATLTFSVNKSCFVDALCCNKRRIVHLFRNISVCPLSLARRLCDLCPHREPIYAHILRQSNARRKLSMIGLFANAKGYKKVRLLRQYIILAARARTGNHSCILLTVEHVDDKASKPRYSP